MELSCTNTDEPQLYFASQKKPDIRELTLQHGLSFPSNVELLMLILGGGIKGTPVEVLAQKVLDAIDGCQREDIVRTLLSIDGMGNAKALAIAAALEFGRRQNAHLGVCIVTPTDLLPYIQHYALKQREHFLCATVNGAHELLHIRVVSVGTISRTLIHPREVFSAPVAEHASAIICCHNHPSGPCLPSKADREVTTILKNAADALGITLLDHLIIAKSGYFSFLEHGLLS